MIETSREFNENTCCLYLSQEESTFNSSSTFRSMRVRDMVDFCIGIPLSNIGDENQIISTSICGECVLNVSNFYSFKKRIHEAQDLLNSLTTAESTDEKNDELQQFIDGKNEMEEMVLVEEHLSEIEESSVDTDSQQISDEPTYSNSKHQPKRPKLVFDAVTITSTSSKKLENATDSTEKVTIQMNECLVCPLVLRDIHQLDSHITSHQNIACKVCKRAFARYSNLKRHFMATHSKPKPFQCDLCGLGFSFSVNLQAHAELHYSGKIRMKQNWIFKFIM